jgi:hypothetical protein
MIVDLIMIGLLSWQILMPAVDNGKYMFQIDRDGTIIRMETQTGKMERCTSDLECGTQVKKTDNELGYKY